MKETSYKALSDLVLGAERHVAGNPRWHVKHKSLRHTLMGLLPECATPVTTHTSCAPVFCLVLCGLPLFSPAGLSPDLSIFHFSLSANSLPLLGQRLHMPEGPGGALLTWRGSAGLSTPRPARPWPTGPRSTSLIFPPVSGGRRRRTGRSD